MLGDGSTNINVLGATAGSGSGAPTAFQAWEKSCEDTLALQGGLYQWALTQQNQRFEDRERLNSELFGVYIDGRNRTDALIEKNNTDHFNLYKYTRDADDDIRKELSDLKLNWLLLKLFVLIKINLSNAKWKRCLRLVSTILIEKLVMLSMV